MTGINIRGPCFTLRSTPHVCFGDLFSQGCFRFDEIPLSISPIAGTVVALPVEQGQTVNAVQSTPTIAKAKVATFDTMTIEAKISKADVINVRTGMPVWFTILGAPNKCYQAVLHAMSAQRIRTFSDHAGDHHRRRHP
nr:HlyD family efflux transporter periplasmic adaptor subunit [Dickeya chrysanthemi]